MTKESQQFLLKLARQTLEYYFNTGKKIEVQDVPEEVKLVRGVFVSLHTKLGELRGCIGHIEPVQEVYKDVIDNTLSAAFKDDRFLPLRDKEMKDIEIEISVLTVPEKLEYSSTEDLLDKLTNEPGVIIKKGMRSATYLPQVWEDFSTPEEFLSSLCLKAGLSADEWQVGDLEILTYQAEVFSE